MSVTLEEARRIVSVAQAAGAEHRMMPLTVAVLDTGGHLVALERQDGSGIMRVEIAIGKAYAALGMGVPTRLLRDRLANRPHFVSGLAAAADGRFIAVPGGVLIRQQGRLIGAVGISGDTSDKDEFCAITAIQAADLEAEPDAPTPGWEQSKL